MKKLVIILLGVVAFFIVLFAAVMFFTGDMVDVAEGFLTAAKSGDLTAASEYLSEDFKSGTSEAELKQFVEQSSVGEFAKATWSSRSINGGRGELVGSLTTDSGGVIPITMNFVKGDGDWKIFSIEKPSAGIQQESEDVPFPSEEEQVRLVAESMQVFAEAVNDKSMAKFHSHISNLWRKQATVQQLDEAFGGFYGAGVDLTILNNFSPQFTEKPGLDDDGAFAIKGKFPTEPSQVYFHHQYVYEGLGWKLTGFQINIE